MASVVPEQKKRTIADMKPYFNTVMVAWIDSLQLDEHKPMEWELSRGIEHDPEKEVESEYACWKPGIDLTITIKDGEKEYTHTFLQTEDGWK